MTLKTPFTDFFSQHVKKLKPSGNGQAMGLCPFHDDTRPSLSVDLSEGLWTCFGCGARGNARQFAERLGVPMPDSGQINEPEATYDYRDEKGVLLYQVVRLYPKDFKQRRPDGKDGWLWNLQGVRRVLYRLPEIQGKKTLYIPEGEKDVDRLWSLRIPATTSPGGAGKWKDEYAEQLRSAGAERLVVLPDNDDEGQEHSRGVARFCLKAGLQVKVVELPDLPHKGDVSDWLNKGHTRDELFGIVKVTPLTTEDVLKDEAEALEESKDKKTDDSKRKRAGREIALPEPEPWPEPVDGAQLLDQLVSTFARYLVLPKGAAEALALWVIHTHTLETAQISARLAFLSPEKRCGKTLALSILEKLTYRPLSASNITSAGVFRTVEAWRPTLLIDEADTFLKNNDELRGVLNSGHSRTGYVIRVEGEKTREPRQFFTFAPVAVAAIGKLPETIQDRSIIITMHRKTKNERVERARVGRMPDVDSTARMVARWAEDIKESLAVADPELPEALHDRAADNWEHLFAIADLAGGAWPERARAVAVALSGDAEREDSSVGVMLLADIAALFSARNTDRLASEEIVKALADMEARPWPELSKGKPITKSALARRLGRFGVKPKTIRFETDTKKGYKLADFSDAFSRYTPFQSVTPSQINEINDLQEKQNVTDAPMLRLEKEGKTSKINDVSDVTDGNRGDESIGIKDLGSFAEATPEAPERPSLDLRTWTKG